MKQFLCLVFKLNFCMIVELLNMSLKEANTYLILNFTFSILIVSSVLCHSLNEYCKVVRNYTKEYYGGETQMDVLHVSAQENILQPTGNDKIKDIYDITFTDINGKVVRLITNMSVVKEQFQGDNWSERSRKDAFSMTSAADNPYAVLLVAVVNVSFKTVCSGSLVTPEWVLTAGHCSYFKPESFIVYAGGLSLYELLMNQMPSSSQVATTCEFYVHPSFSHTLMDADISVVKAGPFKLTNTVGVVRLSTQPWHYSSYEQCKITSYGIVQTNIESKGDQTRKTHNLLVKKPCYCLHMLRKFFNKKKLNRYICNKPQENYGICPGDSGGGLICDNQLKAIAMMLFNIRDTRKCEIDKFLHVSIKCGSKNTLSIFQDTCPFVRWINSHVKLFNDSEISPKCGYAGGIGSLQPAILVELALPLLAMIIHLFDFINNLIQLNYT